MATANLAIRFLVELIGVAAVGYWGFQASTFGPARIALAVGASLALVIVWAIVVAPNAGNALSQARRGAIGTALLLAVAVALAAAGQPAAAVVFGAVVALNWVLLIVLRPDPAALFESASGRSR